MPRERILFAAGVAALAVAALAAYRLLLGPAPGEAPPPEPPAARPPLVLAVARVSGTVELVRGGARTPLAAGDALRADDVLESGPDGAVELAAGASYAVVLEGAARFDVREITATLSRFRLASGLASARVRDEPGRALEIEAGEAVARTTGGEVAVARSGRVVAVAVTAGRASLRAGGAEVALAAGERSAVVDGGPPTAPAPIPASLLLRVSWPKERTTNAPRMTVQGRTEPGALVTLGGEVVEVGPDGRFSHVVHLRADGAHPLSAGARAVGGRAAREDGPTVYLDTRAPDARFETRGLWGPERR